jgi:UDP-N-acetylglucosamine 2-epimerase (non-hydrolysing)
MLKVLSVIGTRPEAIKMAPLALELRKYPERIESRVCATAQHRQLLDSALGIFGVKPDFDLDVMRPNQTLSSLTARVVEAFDGVLAAEKPDWVLVQGDTTTVMAASLVAFYHGVKVGHVEAGLRTNDKRAPFPEEVNRRVADVLADLYFTPTECNRQALLRENVSAEKIFVTGNTVIDALRLTAERVRDRPLGGMLAGLNGRRLILVTAHRRENFGAPLQNVCAALREVAERYADDIHLVYPVHPNPNVRGPVFDRLGGIANVSLCDPVDYEHLVQLLCRAHLVVTDSGGLQEEAPSLGKPVVVLRESTERPEAIEIGAAKLVGTDKERIVRAISELLDDEDAYRAMASAGSPYGDGHASRRIVEALLQQ